LPPLVPEHDIRAESFPHVHVDHTLDSVLKRMSETKLKVLPVVSRTNLRDLQGVVSQGDVLDPYGLGEGESRIGEPTAQETSAPGAVLAGVLAATLGVCILAGFLTYHYRTQRRQRAEDSFQQANELVQKGRNEEAVELYRNALSISHSSEHRLALAMTLVEVGQLNEAAIYLNELLQADPTSGIANLGLARVTAAQGRIQEAVTNYRRAIYGAWPDKPEEKRTQARFDLVDLLSRSGAITQAVTELLALAEEASADPTVKKRAGRLLLGLDAPKEAAGVFQELLRRDPRDAEAYAGLGLAEFAREDYPSARIAFRNSLRRNPADEKIRKRLEITNEIVALDPTLRRLSSAERYRRSRGLLEGALDALDRCIAAGTQVPADSVRESSENARKLLSRRRRPRSYSDASESNILLAEELWDSRERLCGPAGENDEALSRALARASR
jgi:tetratricopeptide (TPR) repeat protein